MGRVLLQKLDSYPHHVRAKLTFLRKLILDVAANTDGVGEIHETLKWGEPAFLTAATRSGSTIRIDWKPAKPDHYAIYLNCKTTLIDSFRSLFPTQLKYEGNRAIVLGLNEDVPENELRLCIAMALRYHLDKKHLKSSKA